MTEEQIKRNKETFLSILDEITIEGADLKGLKQFLLNSDFFEAPASTKYHLNCKGGLCQHSLNVYYNLGVLADIYAPGKYFADTIKVLGLLHDISKANYYEIYYRNVKNETTNVWEKVPEYKVRDASERLIARDHEFNSYLILSRYIPLTEEEAVAIVNHQGGWGLDIARANMVAEAFGRYKLVTLLHLADMTSTYITENE